VISRQRARAVHTALKKFGAGPTSAKDEAQSCSLINLRAALKGLEKQGLKVDFKFGFFLVKK
jgi:hypothetical protein